MKLKDLRDRYKEKKAVEKPYKTVIGVDFGRAAAFGAVLTSDVLKKFKENVDILKVNKETSFDINKFLPAIKPDWIPNFGPLSSKFPKDFGKIEIPKFGTSIENERKFREQYMGELPAGDIDQYKVKTKHISGFAANTILWDDVIIPGVYKK